MNTTCKRGLNYFCLVLLVAVVLSYWFTPTVLEVKHMSLGSDKVLEDKKGRAVQILRTDFSKRKLPWQELSTYPETLIKLLLLSEDKRFYYHPGVDPISLARV